MVSDRPFTKTSGSLATINRINPEIPPKPRALIKGCERLASAGRLNRTNIPRVTGKASISSSCARISGSGTSNPKGWPSAAPKTSDSARMVATARRLEHAVSVTVGYNALNIDTGNVPKSVT
jgi:hypothetical protein